MIQYYSRLYRSEFTIFQYQNFFHLLCAVRPLHFPEHPPLCQHRRFLPCHAKFACVPPSHARDSRQVSQFFCQTFPLVRSGNTLRPGSVPHAKSVSVIRDAPVSVAVLQSVESSFSLLQLFLEFSSASIAASPDQVIHNVYEI